MIVAPNTTLRLLKCPLTIDNKNQLTFINQTSQYNYFNSLPHIEIDNCTYQRKDNVIKYPGKFDDLIYYNYVMYKNINHGNKWFYAFITNIEYVNENMTNVYITTDVWQTWQFDIIFKKSFVEREMIDVSKDIPRSKSTS